MLCLCETQVFECISYIKFIPLTSKVHSNSNNTSTDTNYPITLRNTRSECSSMKKNCTICFAVCFGFSRQLTRSQSLNDQDHNPLNESSSSTKDNCDELKNWNSFGENAHTHEIDRSNSKIFTLVIALRLTTDRSTRRIIRYEHLNTSQCEKNWPHCTLSEYELSP